MAETHPKRQRQESHETQDFEFEPANSNPKRQKTYTNILSFLDEEEGEEEQEPNQDFSAILTSLQQELSSSESTTTAAAFDIDSLPYTTEEVAEVAHEHHLTTGSVTSADCSTMSGGGSVEDEGVVSVMRHLFEASDAELGIPNSGDNIVASSSGENLPFALTENLWDLEDEAADYFTFLQSELFM